MAGASKDSYLSMTELARRLEVPESTMRYYCKRFAPFLPHKGDGRRRRYNPDAEKTLLLIANAMQRSKNATAVELMLQSGHLAPAPAAISADPDVHPVDAVRPGSDSTQASQLLGVMQRQADALGRIADGLEALIVQLPGSAPATPPDQNFSNQDNSVPDLRAEIQDLRQQIFTAEKIHQEDLEQLRKWLAQIGEAVARLGG